jgi:hypothetical protein
MSIFDRINSLFKRPAPAGTSASSAPATGTQAVPAPPPGTKAVPPAPRTATLQKRAALAMEHIHGDEGLTGDLTDPAARLLLGFAEQEVSRMVDETQDLDDESAFQQIGARVQELRRQLRQTAQESAKEVDPLSALQTRLSASRTAQLSRKE